MGEEVTMKYATFLFTFWFTFSTAQAIEMLEPEVTPYRNEWIRWADCEASYTYLQNARKHERHSKKIKSARNISVNLAANNNVIKPNKQVQSTVDYRIYLYKREARKKSVYSATFKANQHINDYCQKFRI